MNANRSLSSLAIVGVGLLVATSASALQERWVDASAAAGGTGTKEKPYQSLAPLATDARQSEEDYLVHVAGGTYEGGVLFNASYGGKVDDIVITFAGEGTAENPAVIESTSAAYCIQVNVSSKKRIALKDLTFHNLAGCALNVPVLESATDCLFEDCTTSGSGGAVYATRGHPAFTNCVFRRCRSTGTSTDAGGGAVYVAGETGNCSFKSCTFDGNSAANIGGAVAIMRVASPGDGNTYSEASDMGSVFEDCIFSNNTATTGGAIFGIVRRCEKSLFADNSATGQGGAWAFNKNLTSARYATTNVFADCLFQRNNATTGSAVAYGGSNNAKAIRFESCDLLENRSIAGVGLAGGHLYSVHMKDCEVRGNVGVGQLSPLDDSDNCLKAGIQNVFVHSRFFGNDSGTGALIGYSYNRAFFDGCTFSGNRGSAVIRPFISSSTQFYTNIVRNCLFEYNTNSESCVKIYFRWATACDFSNNTLVHNIGGVDAAAAFDCGNNVVVDHGTCIANNIVFDNRASDGTAGRQVSPWWDSYAQYCWLETGSSEVIAGTRNCIVGTDPGFAGDGNAKYLPGPSCRNKGLYLAWMDGATDIRGGKHPRLFGKAPDIGCYESSLSGLVILFK